MQIFKTSCTDIANFWSRWTFTESSKLTTVRNCLPLQGLLAVNSQFLFLSDTERDFRLYHLPLFTYTVNIFSAICTKLCPLCFNTVVKSLLHRFSIFRRAPPSQRRYSSSYLRGQFTICVSVLLFSFLPPFLLSFIDVGN